VEHRGFPAARSVLVNTDYVALLTAIFEVLILVLEIVGEESRGIRREINWVETKLQTTNTDDQRPDAFDQKIPLTVYD